MSQELTEIMEFCQQINQQLQIDTGDNAFTFQQLRTKVWYLHVLQIVFPYLADKLAKILESQPDANAIDSFLLLLAKEQIIEEDFLDIKGQSLVDGNYDSIYYVVQLLNALIDRELYEEGSEEGSEEAADEEEQRSRSLKEGSPKNKKGAVEKGKSNIFESNQSDQMSARRQQCHSVMGIDNEFEQSQEMGAQEEASPHYEQLEQEFDQYESPFMVQNKYESASIKPSQNNYVPNAPMISSYPMVQGPITYKPDASEQYDSPSAQGDDYLHHKLERQKSSPTFKKYTTTLKKKPYPDLNYNTIQPKPKKNKKLVSHPTIKKPHRKASNPQAQKLTMEVQRNIKDSKTIVKLQQTQNQLKNQKIPHKMQRPLQEQMRRKKRQLDYLANEFVRQQNHKDKIRKKQIARGKNNEERFQKMMRWREGMMSKQKRQFEKALERKVQNRREQYVKQINKLIVHMEREKQLQQQKDFKEKLMKENQEAAKRMTALEQWYRDRIDIVKTKRQRQRSERQLMHSGHREIIKQIERDLKRQNEQKMIDLTMKYRTHEAQIENDLEQLTAKIIKVYKRC